MGGPYAQDITAMAGNYLARFLGQLTHTYTPTYIHTHTYIYYSKGEIEESTQRNCHCRTEQRSLVTGSFLAKEPTPSVPPAFLLLRLQVCRLFKVIYVEI